MLWPNPQKIYSGKAKEGVYRSMEEQRFKKNKEINVKIEKQIKSSMRLNRLEHEYATELARRNINKLQKSRLLKGSIKKIPCSITESGMKKDLHYIPESKRKKNVQTIQKPEEEYFKNYISTTPQENYINSDNSYIETELTPDISIDVLHTDLTFPTTRNSSQKHPRVMNKSPPIYLTPSNNLFIHIVGKLPPICDPSNASNDDSKSNSPDVINNNSYGYIDYSSKAHPSYHSFRNIQSGVRRFVKNTPKSKDYSNYVRTSVPVATSINLSMEVEARKLKRVRAIRNLERKKLF